MTTKKFLERVVAVIKGDDPEAIGKKIQKRAKAAITAQIAAKEAHTLILEESLENAKEAQERAVINSGNLISDNDSYVLGILRASRDVSNAEQKLADHKEDIDTLKASLKDVSAA